MTRAPILRDLLHALAVVAPLLAASCGAPHPAASPAAADVAAPEALRLRDAMLAEVPGAALPPPAQVVRWLALAREALAAAGRRPEGTELAVLADRAPSVQRIALLLLREAGPWEVLATAPAATGQAGRRGYFITPTGVYVNDGSIMGYRALGTPNENGIRGLGAQGMRVWDFGWTWAPRGWTGDGSEAAIRFLLHATDPDILEPRLGRPGSQGCVRIGGAMNRFLDRHGVLDAEIERLAAVDARTAALLAPDRTPTPIAGRMLIVVDSEATRVPPARMAEAAPARPAGCAG